LRILAAPLDWGLGHAARCTPIIAGLRERGCEVICAAHGPHAALLAEAFADMRFVPLVNYAIRYGRGAAALALRFPFMVARVYRCAAREHAEIARLARECEADAIIADQRFGAWSRETYSVYVTHQLRVLMPPGLGLLERLVAGRLHRAAERFDRVWIPDYEGEDNLAGDLTRGYPLPVRSRYIGPLSRFEPAAGGASAHGPAAAAILSGPEPQRSLFERIVCDQLAKLDQDSLVVRGKPGEQGCRRIGRMRVVSHLAPGELRDLLQSADALCCRGGYTTIMELDALGRNAILVPTPGQTEQEYVCGRLHARGRFWMEPQRRFDLRRGLAGLRALAPPPPRDGRRSRLDNELDSLVELLRSRRDAGAR
jgi:UDP:flavonoid glycosyltransferase YjiC (YdhE family)